LLKKQGQPEVLTDTYASSPDERTDDQISLNSPISLIVFGM
jgi:hypothetical protein